MACQAAVAFGNIVATDYSDKSSGGELVHVTQNPLISNHVLSIYAYLSIFRQCL